MVHGPGIAAVKKGARAVDDVKDGLERGVIVSACENTMESKSLTTDDLIEGVSTVPAGIAEVVRKQRLGWSYAKP